MQLVGKRCVVTGAGSGMGAATARAFVQEGAKVLGLDINDAGLAATVAAAQGSGSVRGHTCDLTKRAEVVAAFDAANELLGGVDVLVNAAGVGQRRAPELCTEDDLDAMLAIHMKAAMFTNQAAFEAMSKADGGSIVNFGSRAGVAGAALAPAYAAGKGAVLAWTRSVARAWGSLSIRVNAVVPFIETPMVAGYRKEYTPEQAAAFEANAARTVALGGKLGDPDRDFAPVMVFLASDASRFITGQTIPVDGGDLMLS
jgi:NAD(P)-dependent dehydrogenase (short-subunit alcohol dehydrogenase family)